MTHAAIAVFLKDRESAPLAEVQKAFSASGTPAVFRFGTEGDASETDLQNARWDAAYLCWTTPVIHETWMLERALSTDEDGQQVIAEAMTVAMAQEDEAGRLIVADHLSKTTEIIMFDPQPALFADEDHAAWDVMDLALLTLAEIGDGLIYAVEDGFYDSEGELLLEEPEVVDSDE